MPYEGVVWNWCFVPLPIVKVSIWCGLTFVCVWGMPYVFVGGRGGGEGVRA